MNRPDLERPAKDDIDKRVANVLRDAGFREPPVDIQRVLQTLKLDREFYDLEDPGLLRQLRHRMLIGTKLLADYIEKIRLQALLLFDDKRVLLDRDLPELKHDWATAHEVGHELIPWHRHYCRGDTLQTLDPLWHEKLEAEANYAASALLFCGEVFATEAKNRPPSWETIRSLSTRYRKNLLPTARRYVEHGAAIPMILLVTTAPWDTTPVDQDGRIRHFIASPAFKARFPCPKLEKLRKLVDENAQQRRGGPVAGFLGRLVDHHGEHHDFHAEGFYNSYYIMTLFAHRHGTRPVVAMPIHTAPGKDHDHGNKPANR